MICAPPGRIWVGMALVAGWAVEVGTALRAETEMGWDAPAMEDVRVWREDGEITCTCSARKAKLDKTGMTVGEKISLHPYMINPLYVRIANYTKYRLKKR